MAANSNDSTLGTSTGASTPAAMTTKLAAHKLRTVTRRSHRAAIAVDAAAVAPNTGQIQPKMEGSAIRARAIAGRNVAGMM